MKKLFFIAFLAFFSNLKAQNQNNIVEDIINEVNNNSQLENLAHELFDVIGPRLVGTPQMKNAHDWAVNKYTDWGIKSYNHQ